MPAPSPFRPNLRAAAVGLLALTLAAGCSPQPDAVPAAPLPVASRANPTSAPSPAPVTTSPAQTPARPSTAASSTTAPGASTSSRPASTPAPATRKATTRTPTKAAEPNRTRSTEATRTTAPEPEAGEGANAWAAASYDLHRGPNRTSRVVLTYDDCPSSAASFRRMVLGAEEQGVALALFPLGTCMRGGTFDAAFARAHGHYVFNHSNNHRQLSKLSRSAAIAELGAPGPQTTWGRPPYGDVGGAARAAYRAKGMRVWLWDVDTNDWRGKSAAQVVRAAVDGARSGSTVLMHMQHQGFTPAALRQIREGLAEKGLKLCRNTGPVPRAPQTLSC